MGKIYTADSFIKSGGLSTEILMADGSVSTATALPLSTATVDALNKRINVVNILEYGAIGDNTTNNTTSLQNAINALTDDGILVIPSGIYKTNDLTLSSKVRVIVEGGGTLSLIGTSNTSIFNITSCDKLTIRDINFVGISDTTPEATGTKNMAIFLRTSSFTEISNCSFQKFNHYGIRVQELTGGTFTEGVRIHNNVFKDFSFDEATATDQYAIWMGNDGEYSQIYQNSFFRVTHVVRFEDGANCTFSGNIVMQSKSLSTTSQYTDRGIIYAVSSSNNAKIRILNNSFNHNETNALILNLNGGGAFPQYTVHGNHAIVVGTTTSARIFYLNNVKGAIITNNVLDPSFGSPVGSGVIELVDCDNAQISSNEIYEGYHSVKLINSTAKLGINNYRMWYGVSPISLDGTSSVSGYDGLKYIFEQPIYSPDLTGTPTAPTATLGTNTTQIATTAFVQERTTTSATTTTLSSATLTSTYPTASIGYKVHALDIIAGGRIYEKTATGWCEYLATITV